MIIDLCICTVDRGSFLAECLAAVGAVDRERTRGHEIRLVIVVNGPDTAALDHVSSLAAATGLAATVVHEAKRGIPFARNAAVRTAIARGAEAIAFIDDDDIPDPGWLGELIEVATATGADLVLGRWRPQDGLDLPPVLENVRFFREPDPAATNRYGLPAWGGTYNMLIRTSLVERLCDGEAAPFDPAFTSTGGSDTDLFVRAAGSGAVVQAAPLSTVVRRWEPERISLQGVMRRAFRLGVTQAMIDTRYRGKRKNRRRLRRRLGDIAAAVLGLCTVRSKPALGVQLLRIAEISGELHGRMGGRARYYEPATSPGQAS